MSSTTTPECLHGSSTENQQVQSNQTVETPINWRENYIRTKLYAHQDMGDSYDALVLSLLAPNKVEN